MKVIPEIADKIPTSQPTIKNKEVALQLFGYQQKVTEVKENL